MMYGRLHVQILYTPPRNLIIFGDTTTPGKYCFSLHTPNWCPYPTPVRIKNTIRRLLNIMRSIARARIHTRTEQVMRAIDRTPYYIQKSLGNSKDLLTYRLRLQILSFHSSTIE